MRRYRLGQRRARQEGERGRADRLAGKGRRNRGRLLLATALGSGLVALAAVWSCAAPRKAREPRAPGAEGGDSPAAAAVRQAHDGRVLSVSKGAAGAEKLSVPPANDRSSVGAHTREQSHSLGRGKTVADAVRIVPVSEGAR